MSAYAMGDEAFWDGCFIFMNPFTRGTGPYNDWRIGWKCAARHAL